MELMERPNRNTEVFVGSLKKGEVVKQERVPGARGKCSPGRGRLVKTVGAGMEQSGGLIIKARGDVELEKNRGFNSAREK